MNYRDASAAWIDQAALSETGGVRERVHRGSPSYRRSLYDGPNPPTHRVDLTNELLSVREESAILSSRALKEGLSDDEDRADADESSGTNLRAPSPHFNNSYDDFAVGDVSIPGSPHHLSPNQQGIPDNELSALLGHVSDLHSDLQATATSHQRRPGAGAAGHHQESKPSHFRRALNEIWGDLTIGNVLHYTPSVILGTLLNILDGLSYGMILFPLGTTVFANLQSAGLSMFYVSTIVSQLVFSLGASKFKACVGSEMIEVVPFFHSIARTISASVGEDDPEAILATTITAFALSSVITGIVFFVLGYLKLGALVGFFPRHILVGCIGGVGFFLLATGFEVSARLEGELEYNLPTLKYLLNYDVIPKWGSCLALAVFLLVAERKFHNALTVPGTLIGTFVVFYIVVQLVPALSLDQLRAAGYIFEAQNSDEPWHYFYSMYKFEKISWPEIFETIPAMLALTFFGLIHVPINIPALAAATQDDNVNVNQELIAHGISNTLSGLVGSIQNYLVYTNSVLFIKSGANSKLSGIMLAIATTGVMVAGPVVIGFIPVIVVAALIFMMGFDLLGEALVDTWGKVSPSEYLTIVTIVVVMGGYDFVVGILVGIVLACMSFVITSASQSPISATFSGDTATSTVIRHPRLQTFLSHVGSQVHIMKLRGPLFFGTNVNIEKAIRKIIDQTDIHIKYVIVDLEHVTHIDVSSADAFARIKRLLESKLITLILSGADRAGHKVRGLRAVDLVQESDEDSGKEQVRLFSDLNTALEFCENQFLAQYYRHRDRLAPKRKSSAYLRQQAHASSVLYGTPTDITAVAGPGGNRRTGSAANSFSVYGATPRQSHITLAAQRTVNEDIRASSKWHKFQQPMPLLMQIVDGLSPQGPEFWSGVAPFFVKMTAVAGEQISNAGGPAAFYLVESGIVQVTFVAHYDLTETVLAGATFGELPFFTDGRTRTVVTAETDVVLWKLTEDKFKELLERKDGQELHTELLRVSLYLTRSRLNTITSFMQVLAA